MVYFVVVRMRMTWCVVVVVGGGGMNGEDCWRMQQQLDQVHFERGDLLALVLPQIWKMEVIITTERLWLR